ncbi:MAG TPA: metallopeptidase family protein [Mycobacteriales bacterium]|jgi:predicted Zn-dependent protease with MMP-like domain|nr:metallopeptidase family protein [Mycobacteriales bacterium]
MVEVTDAEFEQMVAAGIDSLPTELARVMRNVAVVVELEGGPDGLLGLYEGIPLTERTPDYAGHLPDRITIYRDAICSYATTKDEVVAEVRRTVIHEIAHHFGIGDARLHELGWG